MSCLLQQAVSPVCLMVSRAGPDQDAWTTGAQSSPAMTLPVTQPGLSYDLYYKFWKRK